MAAALVPPEVAARMIRDDRPALEAAQRLAHDFARDAVARDRDRIPPLAELQRLSESGLWGITVPRAFGGAEVSNATLAEVIALVSAADGSLGRLQQNHFHALEVLRVDGSAEQQRFFYERALAGRRFGHAPAEGGASVAFDEVGSPPESILPVGACFERSTTIGPFAQMLHAAVDLGIARGAFAATLLFLRERARPWLDAGVERAADDPLAIQLVGDTAGALRAAEALLGRAARFVTRAQAAPDERSVAEASVAAAEAWVLGSEASLLAGTRLFELCGTGATLDGQGLDRFWRAARTHTLHDPVPWKYHAVGNYHLNGRLPPRNGAP